MSHSCSGQILKQFIQLKPNQSLVILIFKLKEKTKSFKEKEDSNVFNMKVAGVRLKYFEELKYMSKMLHGYQNGRVLAQHYVWKMSLSKQGFAVHDNYILSDTDSSICNFSWASKTLLRAAWG